MKVDIIIDFYRKLYQWPLVAFGLKDNKDYINRVIVVNDEPWTPEDQGKLLEHCEGLNMLLLDHERDGFGAARSIVQGAEAAESEYICHIDADIILDTDSLKHNLLLVDEELMVLGTSHDIPRHLHIRQLPDPPIERLDWRHKTPVEPYLLFRDLYWLAHRESYLGVKHNKAFRSYGMVDWEFACRWMTKYGNDSYIIGPGIGYHIGGVDRPKDKIGKEPLEENVALFKTAYKKYVESLRC